MTGEIELVSRLLTISQACGTKLTIEQSAAAPPAIVIQSIVPFHALQKRDGAATELRLQISARAAATNRSPTTRAFASNSPGRGTIHPIQNFFAARPEFSDATQRPPGVLDVLGFGAQSGVGAGDQPLVQC